MKKYSEARQYARGFERMALVTIGIPVYNEEMHLAETIESAINQAFCDIDIVISDNGSTDRSAEIINHYSKLDNRILPVYLGKNMGPTANFWSLLQNTNTKYFVLLGAHDLFLSHYIGDAVAFLEANPEYVMCYPQSKLVDGNDEILRYSDSDIDSAGLNLWRRMAKVAANLRWCTCFHGVFRTDVLRQLPTLKIRGSDHLFLFATAYYGQIHWIRKLGILRRESRQETPAMVEKRRINAGNYSETGSKLYSSWSVTALEHLMFVIEKTNLTLWNKILMFCSLILIFRRRFGVSLMSLPFAFANRKVEAHSLREKMRNIFS